MTDKFFTEKLAQQALRYMILRLVEEKPELEAVLEQYYEEFKAKINFPKESK